MGKSSDICIAGSKTVDDWYTFKPSLVTGSAATWQIAFKDYFVQRLDLRYLNPIKVLQKHGTCMGEGFSIVAIQCSLIEFLESTVEGKNYRWLPKGKKLGLFEYSSSKSLFVKFLSNRLPFSKTFDVSAAEDFYINVRCALLHEARTKGGWKILADDPDSKVVDVSERIVYRNNFQNAILVYIKSYGALLQSDKALQEAFIRKFDNLCL